MFVSVSCDVAVVVQPHPINASSSCFVNMAEMEIEFGGGGEKQNIVAAGIKCECTQSILTRADGSASFKQGKVKGALMYSFRV